MQSDSWSGADQMVVMSTPRKFNLVLSGLVRIPPVSSGSLRLMIMIAPRLL